jgi:hypothetical protein
MKLNWCPEKLQYNFLIPFRQLKYLEEEIQPLQKLAHMEVENRFKMCIFSSPF